MTLEDMMNQMRIEGVIEIRRWDNDNNPTVLFKDDAWELDTDADYMFDDIGTMFAYNDCYDTILCIELDAD